jgi:anthranilate synthase component 1
VYFADPFKVIKTGPGHEIEGDPMKPLEAELAKYRYVQIPQVQTFTGKSDDLR